MLKLLSHSQRASLLQLLQVCTVCFVALCFAWGLDEWAGALLLSAIPALPLKLSSQSLPIEASDTDDRRWPSTRNIFSLMSFETGASRVPLEVSTSPLDPSEQLSSQSFPEVREWVSDLPITLIATMVSQTPKRSLVQVRDEVTGERRLLPVDAYLYDAQIKHILRDRVWIRRRAGRGAWEFIELGVDAAQDRYHPLASVPPSASAEVVPEVSLKSRVRVVRAPASKNSSPPTVPVAASMVSRDPSGGYNVRRAALQMHTKNIPSLTERLRLQMDRGADERLGARLGRLDEGSLLDHMGLQRGDLIIGVNGESPEDERAALAFLEQLLDGQNVEIEVERRGRRRKMNFRSAE